MTFAEVVRLEEILTDDTVLEYAIAVLPKQNTPEKSYVFSGTGASYLYRGKPDGEGVSLEKLDRTYTFANYVLLPGDVDTLTITPDDKLLQYTDQDSFAFSTQDVIFIYPEKIDVHCFETDKTLSGNEAKKYLLGRNIAIWEPEPKPAISPEAVEAAKNAGIEAIV